MSKEIYISTTPHETRLAIVEEEQLAEVYFERENEYTLAGSIYNGKVTRVLPGMQSSFVDIGLERDAFLYVTDFMEEAGDTADFETSDNLRKVQPTREGADVPQRDAGRVREDGRRGRSGRERANREQSKPAAPESRETELFDEPVAPRPVEAPAIAEPGTDGVAEEQGSRRWRGRRGRRRGRGGREGESPLLAESGPTNEAANDSENLEEEPERLSLEGSADDSLNSGVIEIDVDAEPRVPVTGRAPSPNVERGRGGRGRRGRETRGRDREDRPRLEEGASYDQPVVEHSDVYEVDAEPAQEPVVLPGESIRKYRNPEEVAAEDAAQVALRGPSEVVARSTPDVQIVGWDGGAVLPGETLSRRSGKEAPSRADESRGKSRQDGRNDASAQQEVFSPAELLPDAAGEPLTAAENEPSRGSASLKPIALQAFALEAVAEHAEAGENPSSTLVADEETIAAASAAEETGELAQHPGDVDSSAAAEREQSLGAGEDVAEYEPAEGEAVSLGENDRREYRRSEKRVSEEQGNDPELLAEAPDRTTYDLDRSGLPEEAPTIEESPIDLSREASGDASLHEFTTLDLSGDMVSVPPATLVDDTVHLPVPQDTDEPILAETSMQASVLSRHEPVHEERTEQEAEDEATTMEDEEPLHDRTLIATTETQSQTDGSVPQFHAYGEGDLEEEEVDGEEYEYDLAVAVGEDDEFGDYEEQTLDGSDAIDAVLEELSLDENGDDQEEDPEEVDESAAGGFTVDDFGGEPIEMADAAPSTLTSGERRERSRDGRRGGSRDRDRRPGGGFRGGASAAAAGGGDRGRGRGRQSVQTMDLPAINELLKPGQEILVQIAKEPIAKKGARITSHIALPGRFLVFMPTVNHTGVSRKISSDEERRRLKSILLSEKGDAQGGFIVRTAADGASEEELRNDLRFLIQLWQDIKARSESSKSPALIYHDLSLIERILRDQVTDNFSAIWVDTEAEYERVLRFLQRFQPSLVRRVKLYTKETPMFEHFGVTAEINKALKSKVWLKSGGSIVIDQTEALVAIDINTGKYVGKTARLEDTILKTNLDAIPEIVRQIRLRDLGGIIVIDFIDMDDRRNRARVMQVLEEELKNDRAPSKVLPFNDFGLVIMTRKRVKQSLERTLCVPDAITEGTGMIKSPITVANEIYTEMRKMQRQFEKNDVMLRVHPEVVKTLKANGGKRLQELEEMTRKTILVKSDSAINPEQFDIH